MRMLLVLLAVACVSGVALGQKKTALELQAAAALQFKAKAKKPGFVNLAPVPREVPKDMPTPCECCKAGDVCDCGAACKCKTPGECKPAAKKAEVKAEAKLVVVGYQTQRVCVDGVCQTVQIPVYGYR